MARSLKASFPEMAQILEMTVPALYACQVMFARNGLLKVKPGRGPGSGVPGTAESLATFVICLMTKASKQENVELARRVLSVFLDDFVRILRDPRVSEIVINLSAAVVHVTYGQAMVHTFGAPRDCVGIRRMARIEGETIRALAALLAT